MRLAVIPARGGSKRIPGKNLREFCGKPIIAYSVEAALGCGLFDHVVVSTDDPLIAKTARRFGAETPFVRPAELSGDHTGTSAVVKHAIRWFQQQGLTIVSVCCLYPTAPFVRPKDLTRGYETLVAGGTDYAFTVTRFPFPIQRALRIDPESGLQAFWPGNINRRSQDLEEAFHDAGQFYWGKATAFLGDSVMYSPASTPIVLPRHRVQDIDTEEDWIVAERLYQLDLSAAADS